ncbi:DUF1642 domain-containing protein [Enterococcus thailandicus]|uniref:DUF1642 domain-containing protein n=1 Tax=Enterococcus thailandicus TaxID=417368 RepID=UPI0032E46C7A
MDKLSKVIKQIEENELLDKDEIVNQLKEINRQTTVTFKKNEIELAELIIARIDKTYKRFGATLEDIYTIVSDDEMRRWVGTNANITKCFFASKYGYEVEKEPLYYVKMPFKVWDEESAELKTEFLYLGYDTTSDETMFFPTSESRKVFEKDFKTKLAEATIKSADEKYWAFAVPVDEVVEG